MDDTDRMHECIAHRMELPTKLPPEERVAARHTPDRERAEGRW